VAERQKDPSRTIAIYERLVRIAPEDIHYRRQLAKAYDTAGITRQAALAYQEVVKRDTHDLATQRRLALLYAEVPGFQGSALPLFKKVLEKNPADAEVHRRMGELYLDLRNYLEAEKHIRETIRYTPNDAKAHNNLATLYGKQNRYNDAILEYTKALELNPQYLAAQFNLPQMLLAASRREEAIVALRQYLKQKPTDQVAITWLAEALRDLGRREEAIAEYEALDALRSNDSASRMNLAKLTRDLGKGRSAAGIYEQILEKNPTDINALKEAGLLYIKMDVPLRAIFCWQRALALKPGDKESQRFLADCYQQIGSDDAAIKAYEIVGKNGDASAWKSVAKLRFKHDERDLALFALREAIKINPQEKEAREFLAASLQSSSHPEEHDEALKLNQELIQLDNLTPDKPKNIAAHLNLANLLSEYNRFSEAQDEYEIVIRQKPDHSIALMGLGVLWRKKAKYDKAADYYKQALKAESDKKDADKKVLRAIHYNLGVAYDYYLNKQELAQDHYRQFIQLGGDPKKVTREEQRKEKNTSELEVDTTEKMTPEKTLIKK
jgi:tetratricopeptide (TPR) repeat protein